MVYILIGYIDMIIYVSISMMHARTTDDRSIDRSIDRGGVGSRGPSWILTHLSHEE